MQESDFNQKIRKFCVKSAQRNKKSYDDVVADIANDIGIKDPSYFAWDMKHDNKGLLLYEKNGMDAELFEDHFLNSLYLLNFCPVF